MAMYKGGDSFPRLFAFHHFLLGALLRGVLLRARQSKGSTPARPASLFPAGARRRLEASPP